MRVSELIEKLNKMSPDAYVAVGTHVIATDYVEVTSDPLLPLHVDEDCGLVYLFQESETGVYDWTVES